MIVIRPESPTDHGGVDAVVRAAFEGPAEAELVARLRRTARPQVSLVAVENTRVLGHIFFSPVTIDPAPRSAGLLMGLAPLAVDPARQRVGIGADLSRAGLDACRALGAWAVVVLGHPAYYPRFGFQPGSRFGLGSEYGSGDSFMVLELLPGVLAGVTGLVRYLPEFAAV
jgi:putative acetyltransferase